MLCRRSASLMMMTRMSWAVARSMLRQFSAWASSWEENWRLSSLVMPTTNLEISSPNSLRRSSAVVGVSSMTSCRSPAQTVGRSIFQSIKEEATASQWTK